ncbi:hypothetical protein DFJ58DRAFT_842013 [Suillus subalutaceus]|uniref:uncharacterized protein n=1 Tax=Suillus subalutaceus TaxID=48586 RepID=UPI001B86B5F2|nr:uncharacterized protein DFJ58DRAFT_842013 [Suillus subalutaceus]KAG1851836.1 hypothetical protein DFJ58DRAFT_842013 [Suillus subalutaceus]
MAVASSTSLDTAVLISTVLEGMLYGFSILMFIGTMWAMTYKRSIRDFNRPVVAAAVLLSHIVFRIIRFQYGFVTYQDVSRETYLIKNSIYVLQTLLGDAVAIYRCYVVWQAAWVIILPSLLWCCVAVNVECMGAFCGLTLAANLTSSGLLAYRIWKIERRVSTSRTTKVLTTSIMRVIMESAILYSITLLATLTPVISIAFYMVIIRIAIGQNTLSQVLTARGAMTSETERGSFPQRSVKPLQVDISRSTHTDSTRVDVTSSWNQSRPPTAAEVAATGGVVDDVKAVIYGCEDEWAGYELPTVVQVIEVKGFFFRLSLAEAFPCMKSD